MSVFATHICNNRFYIAMFKRLKFPCWMEILTTLSFLTFYIIVFLHEPEDKFWIAVGGMPKKSPTIQLGINNQTEIITIVISINEKMTILRNQPNGQCRNYDQNPRKGFIDCNKNYILDYLQKTTNCTLPGKNIRNQLFAKTNPSVMVKPVTIRVLNI